MKHLLSIILTLALALSASFADAALTPQQVAQKTAAVVSNAKTISATFTFSGNGRKSQGSIKSSGNKFSVILPDVSTWYDGKEMYTYNPRTVETTVITPTAAELMESNPLLYVKGGGSNYTYKFSTVKRTGKYVVDLTPVKKNSEIKKMTITVNSNTFNPERIVVTTSGGVLTVDITSFKTGVDIPASEFIYPKSKYPKAEIIDLR